MTSERIQRRIERLLDQAEESADKKDWSAVRETALEVLGLDPENADAQALIRSSDSVAGTSDISPTSSTTITSSTPQPTSFADGRCPRCRVHYQDGVPVVAPQNDKD